MKKKFVFEYSHYKHLSEMNSEDLEVTEKAKEVCKTAYAPYSKFQVGAAARLKSGKIITGSNQESGVFPAGVCAERNLLYHHQAHYKNDPIVTIAIASIPDEKECYPCGICRQVLNDSESRQGEPIKVIMSGHDSATVIESTRQLLPFTFELD